MSVYKYAIDFVLNKNKSVVPCYERSKKPAIAWKEFQERYPTEQELKRWFYNTRMNIALVCGEISGVTVVDCDSQPAIDEYYLTANSSELIVNTSRGLHFYHQYTVGKNSSKNGIDVKNDGSLIMLPPSIHPNGTSYAWESTGPMTKYDPNWFQATRTQIKNTLKRIETETALEALKRCRAYIAKVEPAISGQGGHKKCFYVACRIRDFLSDHMSWEQALPVLREYNERAEPPFSERELEHKLSDAWSKR